MKKRGWFTFDHREVNVTSAMDRHGDGWVYYASPWSEGVPVSNAEREQFLLCDPFIYRSYIAKVVEGRTPATDALGMEWLDRKVALLPPAAYVLFVLIACWTACSLRTQGLPLQILFGAILAWNALCLVRGAVYRRRHGLPPPL